jgi:hypothetical protein
MKTAAEPVSMLANGDFQRNEESWDVANNETSDSTFVAAKAGAVHACAAHERSSVEGTIRGMWPAPGHAGIVEEERPAGVEAVGAQPRIAADGRFCEQAAAPYTKSVSQLLQLTPEWKEYEVRGQSNADYATGAARVTFHMAHGPGTIEVAGVRLFNPNAPALTLVRSTASPQKPESLIINGAFTQPLQGNWGWGDGAPIHSQSWTPNINDPAAREYSKALRLAVTTPARKLSRGAFRWASRSSIS